MFSGLVGLNVLSAIGILSNKVQNEPMVIVKPIAIFLGYILQFIFNIAYSLNKDFSMGISIIFFTIVVRLLMVPLAVKQQKSMAGMQRLQPEMEKIKKKHGDSKDPEVQKKINTEIQALYAKHGVNPLTGCLPLFIQFPIFIALSYIMQQPFLFIKQLGGVYEQLATKIMQMPDWLNYTLDLASNHVAKGKQFDIGVVANLEKVLSKFTPQDWTNYMQTIPANFQTQLLPLLTEKNGMEYFLGIHLLAFPGYSFPGILIPILSAASTFLSSWVMMKMTVSNDKNAKMQQQMMLIMMPLMMGFFTFSTPCGVGIYWITSSFFQMVQQIILNKRYSAKKGV